jgi:hypothetical protein
VARAVKTPENWFEFMFSRKKLDGESLVVYFLLAGAQDSDYSTEKSIHLLLLLHLSSTSPPSLILYFSSTSPPLI